MNAWRRFFGLDPVDMALHLLGSIFLVAAVNEASGSDALSLVAATAAVIAFGVRRRHALMRLPRETEEPTRVPARVVELEERLFLLEEREGRLQELEERLDFAERLLAQRQEPMRLNAGRDA